MQQMAVQNGQTKARLMRCGIVSDGRDEPKVPNAAEYANGRPCVLLLNSTLNQSATSACFLIAACFVV